MGATSARKWQHSFGLTRLRFHLLFLGQCGLRFLLLLLGECHQPPPGSARPRDHSMKPLEPSNEIYADKRMEFPYVFYPYGLGCESAQMNPVLQIIFLSPSSNPTPKEPAETPRCSWSHTP